MITFARKRVITGNSVMAFLVITLLLVVASIKIRQSESYSNRAEMQESKRQAQRNFDQSTLAKAGFENFEISYYPDEVFLSYGRCKFWANYEIVGVSPKLWISRNGVQIFFSTPEEIPEIDPAC